MSELLQAGYPGSDSIKRYNENGVIEVIKKRELIVEDNVNISRLHRGEKDTIIEYINGTGDFIIIDDGKGAAYCRDNSIPYINALLVPGLLCCVNKITDDECSRKMDELKTLGRYSEQVKDHADNFTCEKLKMFFSSNDAGKK